MKDDEPKFKDQGTMVSFERLSLVIEYNQIGSLTSLGRVREHGIITRARSNSMRRGSYSSGMFKVTKGSSSKVDLLKSAVEVNHHKSSSQMRISNNYLNRQANNSTGKVNIFIFIIPIKWKIIFSFSYALVNLTPSVQIFTANICKVNLKKFMKQFMLH